MSKIGYLLAAILIAGLGAFALWPAATQATAKLLTSTPPAAWTSTVGGTVQRVTKERVTLTVGGKSYEFAPDPEKAGRLWNALGSIEVPATRIVPGIGPDQLAGYGIDGSHEAAAEDGSALVRWGGSGGQAYVWNGITRTLLAVDPAAVAGLDGAAGSVARTQVLALPMPPRRLTVDTLSLVNEGGWQAELFRNRPPFDSRVQALLGQLARTAIDDLQGVQVFGLQVVGTLQIPALDALPEAARGGPFPIGPQPARTVTVYDAAPGGAIAISGYPAQRIDAGRTAELRAAFAAFRRDVLVDLYTRINRDDVLRIEFSRDGRPWWSLHRREKPPAVGGFSWDVVWEGGRESAPDDAVDRVAHLLSTAAVREPVGDAAALDPLPAGSVLVTVVSDRPDGRPVRVAVGNGELRSATHRARLDDGGELERSLRPDRFLDDRLTRRDASRVAKIQRRFRDAVPPRDEVVMRSEGGTWARSWPAPAAGGPAPVDGAAVDRFVRVLAAARMREVAIIALDAGAADARALLDAPEFEMDVRFAAVPGGQASNDETDLDLSAAQDWGIALRRDGDRWLGVDKDLGLRFTLDADAVEEFRRPFDPGQVFPVVASAVTSVAITRPGGAVVNLARAGQDWTVDGQPADAVAMRRWFRSLGALQVPSGTALDARAPEPTPGEIESTIACTVPSISGDPFQQSETLTFAALKPNAQGQPVHVWSNRGGSRFPRGRAVLPPAQVAELFADAAAFRR